MEKEDKEKRYEKPKVTKIRLDARTAVLGFCKTISSGGPGWTDCDAPAYCSAPGS